MSEIGGDFGDYDEITTGNDEVENSTNEAEAKESGIVDEGIFSDVDEGGNFSTSGSHEVTDTSHVSITGKEVTGSELPVSAVNDIIINPYSTTPGISQILERPVTAESAKETVESNFKESIKEILKENGKYMSEKDLARVEKADVKITAKKGDPFIGRRGSYSYNKGRSSINIHAINERQIERTTRHESNHFASKNREVIVPQPDKHGYTVYKSVGTRTSSYFHSHNGISNYSERGRGLNEGLTTMFSAEQLASKSPEKGLSARQQTLYAQAVEITEQLQDIIGKESLKEAYYGGDLKGLETKIDSLAGQKGYERLCSCLDRAISRDPAERIDAMKEAHSILETMEKNGNKKV